MGNYFINLVRVLFPIELIFKGVKYIPFILYQIYITISLIKKVSKIRNSEYTNRDTLLLAIFIAYLLVASLYEPDFGSFIRHESTLSFIMFDLFLENKKVCQVRNNDYLFDMENEEK